RRAARHQLGGDRPPRRRDAREREAVHAGPQDGEARSLSPAWETIPMPCTMSSPSAGVGGGAAPTPVEMAADVAISTALLVTARWSRPPSSPCCALGILDLSTAGLLARRCTPDGTGLALPQPTRSSPCERRGAKPHRG